jgi:hypothetical protein
VPLTQSGECSLDGALSTHRADAAAGETCRQNVEPVLRDKDGGGKLRLVLLVAGAKLGAIGGWRGATLGLLNRSIQAAPQESGHV